MASCIKCGHRPIKKRPNGERACRRCGPMPPAMPKCEEAQ